VKRLALIALAAAPLLLTSLAGDAAQFRRAQPIARPAPLPEGFVRSPEPVRVPQAMIERAVRDVFAAWNGPGLDQYLSPRFFDRDRLMDNIAQFAPQDARLRLLGLQSVRQLGQMERPSDSGGRLIVLRVSVTALTAVEFEDAVTGFQRLEGLQEYIFTMTVEARG
jgi:hypothetical protein